MVLSGVQDLEVGFRVMGAWSWSLMAWSVWLVKTVVLRTWEAN